MNKTQNLEELRRIVERHKQEAIIAGGRLALVAASLKAEYGTYTADELMQFDTLCKEIYKATVEQLTEQCCRIQALVFADIRKVRAREEKPVISNATGTTLPPKTSKPTAAAPGALADAMKKLSPAQLQQMAQMLAAMKGK